MIEQKTSAVADAKMGDLYLGHKGSIWRVTVACPEPYVVMERVDNEDIPDKVGGISDPTWERLKRIHRDGEDG